jgi:hypothetical protein
MATAYSIADGHDNEAGYATLAPQPAMPDGIHYPVYRKAASGKVYPDGVRVAWLEYQNITPAEYAAILSDCGLTSADYNDITAALPDEDYSTFSDYNGTIYHYRTPEYRQFRNHLYRRARFRIEITGDT